MNSHIALFIILIVILIIFSAFFSASETAYTSVNKIKLKTEIDDGDKKAKSVLDTCEKYDRLLSTILIGNNLVNIASATIATVLFTKALGDNGSWISTLAMTLIVLIFGEAVPKGFAKTHAEGFAKFVNPFIKLLLIIFFPVSWCLEKITNAVNTLFKAKEEEKLDSDDLLTIIDEIEEDGTIKPYEKELISSAVKFDDINIAHIVTPRKDITAVSTKDSIDDIRKVFEETKYSRIPVYEGTIDNIIGILLERDFYSYLIDGNTKDFDVKKIMSKANYVAQDSKISEIFKMFKRNHFHMAIVLDQFDSTLGIVTLEDVIEELVGEIFDESDEIFEETRKIDDDHFIATGEEILDDTLKIIGEEDDNDDKVDVNQTINSWLSSIFERIPSAGDNFIFRDKWKVMVKSATKKGAKEVEFTRL